MVKEIPMTEDIAAATVDQVDANAKAVDSTVDAASVASTETPKPATPKAPRSTAKKPAAKKAGDDDASSKQQTCAACGKTAVFTERSLVGGSVALEYHDCEPAAQLVHDFLVAYASDQQAPRPVLAAGK